MNIHIENPSDIIGRRYESISYRSLLMFIQQRVSLARYACSCSFFSSLVPRWGRKLCLLTVCWKTYVTTMIFITRRWNRYFLNQRSRLLQYNRWNHVYISILKYVYYLLANNNTTIYQMLLRMSYLESSYPITHILLKLVFIITLDFDVYVYSIFFHLNNNKSKNDKNWQIQSPVYLFTYLIL